MTSDTPGIPRPLEGQVAVVAGATRGAGRGIARALAEAGAVVYCTGRSVTGNPSPYARPETIDETVDMIARAGDLGAVAAVDPRPWRGARGPPRRVSPHVLRDNSSLPPIDRK